ncbi:hypothetical protein RAS2_20090 [Phycisphaerae bacterium RAS2]|nr:hypothetical protein RAS2_20090 [Phycisphaerae bacterium RAS2]
MSQNSATNSEGLPLARLCMVLASLSPLFILWAIRGINCVPDRYLVPACIALVVLPNLVLFGRLALAKRANDVQSKVIGSADDHRDHLLVYLFAVLLPLWDAGADSVRSGAGIIVALLFVVFLFWHMNLHYMNLLFALIGRRVYSVYDQSSESMATDAAGFILITWRTAIPVGTRVDAFRLSNRVYWEKRNA